MTNIMISLALFAVVLGAFSVSLAVADADDNSLPSSSRRALQAKAFPFGYMEPPWFQRIEAEFTGINLQRCMKRNPNGPKDTPVSGESCSASSKTCYFGTQDDCDPSHPAFKCFCDGASGSQTWKCESLTCPSRCPPDGVGFEFYVEPGCPASTPEQDQACVSDIEGLVCRYGREDCCGTCNAEQQMSCSADTGVWNVIFLDPCLLSSIEGCTCPSLEERSTATCYTEGQQCSYTSVTSIPQFTCSIEETCTCTTSGKYQCRLSTEVCTPLTITAFIPSG